MFYMCQASETTPLPQDVKERRQISCPLAQNFYRKSQKIKKCLNTHNFCSIKGTITH